MKTLICQRMDLTILRREGPDYKPSLPVYFLFNGEYSLYQAERKLWEDRDKVLQALENYFKYPVKRKVKRDIVQKFYYDKGWVFSQSKNGVWPLGKDSVLIELD